MKHSNAYLWLQHHLIGQCLAQHERAFFQAALNPKNGDCVLNIDCPPDFFEQCPPNIRMITQRSAPPADIIAHRTQLPWRDHEFDTICAAHGLEHAEFAHTLAQWYRITKAQGKLLVSVVNPHAPAWQHACTKMPNPHAQTPQIYIDYAHSIGWQLEQCYFLCHLPIFRQPEPYWLRICNRICRVFAPKSAMIYGLVFSKPVFGLCPNAPTKEALFSTFQPASCPTPKSSGSIKHTKNQNDR